MTHTLLLMAEAPDRAPRLVSGPDAGVVHPCDDSSPAAAHPRARPGSRPGAADARARPAAAAARPQPAADL